MMKSFLNKDEISFLNPLSVFNFLHFCSVSFIYIYMCVCVCVCVCVCANVSMCMCVCVCVKPYYQDKIKQNLVKQPRLEVSRN